MGLLWPSEGLFYGWIALGILNVDPGYNRHNGWDNIVANKRFNKRTEIYSLLKSKYIRSCADDIDINYF